MTMRSLEHSGDPAVDEVAAALDRCRPTLDDVTRARIATRLASVLSNEPSDEPSKSARRPTARQAMVAATLLVAAAAAALVLWRTRSADTPTRAEGHVAAAPSTSNPGQSPVQVTPPPARDTAPAVARPIRLASGAHVALLGNTEVRMGASPEGADVRFDEGAIEIDGTAAQKPTRLTVGRISVVSTHATFAAYAERGLLRVEVRVGEVVVFTNADAPGVRVTAPDTQVFSLAARPAAARTSPAAPAAAKNPGAETPTPRDGHATVPERGTEKPPAAQPASAEDTYRAAESAIAAGEATRGTRLLERLVTEFPGDRRVDAARYDLARLAYRAKNLPRTRRLLEAVLASRRDPVVVEPAHQLLCRVLIVTRSTAAESCITRFRRTFRRSAHDAELLAQLSGLVHRRAGCSAATQLYDEYLRRYPRGAFAQRARAARTRCRARAVPRTKP